MSPLATLKGMRYPDEYLIRMFYKESLGLNPGHVLELGCGSANNLLMFASHGWAVTGLDVETASLENGRHNLSMMGFEGRLLHHDLRTGLPVLNEQFDALLVPSTLYYLSREAAVECLTQVRNMLKRNAVVYLRMRLPDDHRVGRGQPAGRNAWVLECKHTGEEGLLNVFWNEHELVDLLHATLQIESKSLTSLRVTYENLQQGYLVRNSDIVLWGRLP